MFVLQKERSRGKEIVGWIPLSCPSNVMDSKHRHHVKSLLQTWSVHVAIHLTSSPHLISVDATVHFLLQRYSHDAFVESQCFEWFVHLLPT